MNSSAKLWTGAAVLAVALIICLWATGPKPVRLRLPVLDTAAKLSLQHFDESGANDPGKPSNYYQGIRTEALTRATVLMARRDTLNLLFNVLSIISVVASFAVTVIGANNGWHLTAEKIDKALAKVKNADTKKWIILLSSVAVLSTTLANRASAYADKEQGKGLEIIGLVKTADTKVAGALDNKEISNAADNLELDLAKY